MQLPAPGASGLAIFTPDAVNVYLDKWVRVYNPYCEIIAPHITIAYRGFAPANEWRRVRDDFAETIAAFPAFDISLETTDTFADEDFVLWLKPKDGGALMRLRNVLAQKFPKYFPASPHPYVPHLSIGFFDSREAMLQAQAVVQAELAPIQFRAEAVTFMVFGTDGKWGDIDVLPLGVKNQR
jgi:2'-5' RNA ligase